jgi:hypothetical protein
MTKTQTLTAAQVAEELGTDGRTFRRFYRGFVRANGGTVGEDTPGKGKRYAFEAKDVKQLKGLFEEWDAARTKAADDAEEVAEEA